MTDRDGLNTALALLRARVTGPQTGPQMAPQTGVIPPDFPARGGVPTGAADPAAAGSAAPVAPGSTQDATQDTMPGAIGETVPRVPGVADALVISPGVVLRIDPAARIGLTWSSPRARLLELRTTVTTPGDWLGLHVALPPLDLGGVAWFGFVARSAAATALVARACLRSGLPEGGFSDAFFDRHLLSQPGETDHADVMAPDRRPDLPARAPWRDFVLFLPSTHDIAWALHDLRLVRL